MLSQSVISNLMRFFCIVFQVVLLISCSKQNNNPKHQHFSWPHRPQFHFTPIKNWMNDPNGTVFFNGTYHLYFQHNPCGKEWGYMSWEHAQSKDMVFWEHLPIAISQDDSTCIFSGSVIADYKNTAGFGKENKWIMANIQRKDTGSVLLYESEDLVNWKYMSEYKHENFHDGYECPVFRPVPVVGDSSTIKWIMKWDIPYQSHYVLGRFDGQKFEADENQPVKTLDHGNFYASISWNGLEQDELIFTGWITEEPRENKPWTGVQSLPRKLFLRKENTGYQLYQEPLPAIAKLRKKHWGYHDMTAKYCNKLMKKQAASGKSLEIHAVILPEYANKFGINVLKSKSDSVSIVYQCSSNILSVTGGFKEYSCNCPLVDDRLSLRIFVDHSVLEIFINDGRQVLTASCYPDTAGNAISLFENSGMITIERLDVWQYHSIWQKNHPEIEFTDRKNKRNCNIN